MEELDLIIKAVAGLPHMAIWALVVVYGYKVAVIGSIYGVIRFSITKLHDVMVFRKTPPPPVPVDGRVVVDGICIGDSKEQLLLQLQRVAGRNVSIKSAYIHKASVAWLAEAIDAKLADEAAAGVQSLSDR
jgi:hypothetical protein